MSEEVNGWRYRKVVLSPSDAASVAAEIARQLAEQAEAAVAGEGVILAVLTPVSAEVEDEGHSTNPQPVCPPISKCGDPVPAGCPPPTCP